MTSPYNDRDVWDEEVRESRLDEIYDRTGYSRDEIYERHLEAIVEIELFYTIPEADYNDFMTDYIAAMVNGTMDRDEFFDHWDIDAADFPWADWREAMGYD